MKTKITYLLIFTAAALASSCRKDKPDEPKEAPKVTKGLFILNEGGFNASNSSIDYFDYATQKNNKNVYAAANGATKWDVGNDIQTYGSKVYAVINNSNLLIIANATTLKSAGGVTISQPRNIAFYNGKALITSSDDHVYVVDTATIKIESTIKVGRDPEHLVVVGDKLYVANSGGFDYPHYDNTVSVVDLKTFTELKKIKVDVNLSDIVADKYGDVYVTSRGDYGAIKPNLYAIDTKTDIIKKNFNIPAGMIAVHGDNLYIINTDYSLLPPYSQVTTYKTVDVNTETLKDNFITDGSDKDFISPYGIAADPVSGDIFIADATDYSGAGKVYCFGGDGKRKYSFETGVAPAHFAFFSN
ncbi:YncE family protein [Pedobacter sp. HMF7647]|uniref:YncE family protein n=1 Tax=Hufsiella arboris TaxID=2695275 RepID=A0A7K1YC56_9SPHI|nr:YncE family protein [Hufsiella arboris]MXV51951.1 YncE family protein [Hufsiella arboris]